MLNNSEGAAQVGQRHKVLVVDDNPIALWVFERKLRSKGFTVVTAKDPGAATRVARQEQVDLIILDVNFWMSDDVEANSRIRWDGFTVMQWLRRFPELAHIPVIVVSADEPARCEKKALAAGAVAYYQKPVDCNELIAAMIRALEKNLAPRSAA